MAMRPSSLANPLVIFTICLLGLACGRRPQGWLVFVAVRLGNVAGRPSEVLPWLDPGL